ncbi:MAG: agmatine deiminase family protein [Bacteroidaceae bacterium]|nr:agmatine deiminase family protein [Bacteroidaceae bacterium]
MNYRLPAEWAPQSGVQLTWPHAETDWNYMLPSVTECFLCIAREIAKYEKLLIVVPSTKEVYTQLTEANVNLKNVLLFEAPTNDTWARDHGALTLLNDEGNPLLLDFQFNGWGTKFAAEKDNALTYRLHQSGLLHGSYESHLDFVLEGGSIESDGCGTLLTTTGCLLAPHRNQPLTQHEIEQHLLTAFRAQRVLWLDYGELIGDDTDGHIDTLARLCPNDTITYVQCLDPEDVHYPSLQKMEQQLQSFRTTSGLPYRLLPLPLPEPIVDEEGERLPATYANFLVINGAVLYPTYAQPGNDKLAEEVLAQAFPEYKLVAIDCLPLIRQHGSLHCITMQYPKNVL